MYYKALGFDGKVPDLDYFLNYNKLFYLLFKEDYKYTEYSSSVCVSLGNFLEKQRKYNKTFFIMKTNKKIVNLIT